MLMICDAYVNVCCTATEQADINKADEAHAAATNRIEERHSSATHKADETLKRMTKSIEESAAAEAVIKNSEWCYVIMISSSVALL